MRPEALRMIRQFARRRRPPASRAKNLRRCINTEHQDDVMFLCPYRLVVGALLIALVDATAVRTGLYDPAYAHEDHQGFAAGEPGDPQKPARTVKVVMR